MSDTTKLTDKLWNLVGAILGGGFVGGVTGLAAVGAMKQKPALITGPQLTALVTGAVLVGGVVGLLHVVAIFVQTQKGSPGPRMAGMWLGAFFGGLAGATVAIPFSRMEEMEVSGLPAPVAVIGCIGFVVGMALGLWVRWNKTDAMVEAEEQEEAKREALRRALAPPKGSLAWARTADAQMTCEHCGQTLPKGIVWTCPSCKRQIEYVMCLCKTRRKYGQKCPTCGRKPYR